MNEEVRKIIVASSEYMDYPSTPPTQSFIIIVFKRRLDRASAR
jgi:hypothetical protein